MLKIILFICLSFLVQAVAMDVTPCESTESCLSLAKKNFSVGKLDDAREHYQSLVELGDLKEGHFGLGAVAAEFGDYSSAAHHLELSCKNQHPPACNNLEGLKTLTTSFKKEKDALPKLLVAKGMSRLERNHLPVAEKLFESACGLKFSEGCLRQGEMLDALGKRDEAKEKFQSLCDNKNLEGCRLLGVFEYRAGNRDLAWKIFDKACKKKHFPSCGFLGGLEVRAGKLESGLNLLKSACQHNVLDACESLAFQYSKAKDDANLKTTMAKVKKMLESQCDAGKPEACRRLASLR